MKKLELKTRDLLDYLLDYTYYILSDNKGFIQKAIKKYKKEHKRESPLVNLIFGRVNYGLFDLDYNISTDTWIRTKDVIITYIIGTYRYIIKYNKEGIKTYIAKDIIGSHNDLY